MGKWVVAVCDRNEEYRDRFVTYLIHHKPELVIHSFTNPEAFLGGQLETAFDLVIIGSDFEVEKETLRERKVPILSLTESFVKEPSDSSYLEETRKDVREVSMCRYQSMEQITHEMAVLLGGKKSWDKQEETMAGAMEIIGVYSPVEHEMQLPFSLLLANTLGETQKVLYLNLLSYSGFAQIFDLAWQQDMSEIILALRNKRLTPEIFIQGTYQMEKFSYLLPFENPSNIQELEDSDFMSLFEFILRKMEYEVVVLDLGTGVGNLPWLFETCSSVYCLQKEGFFFECRRQQFLNHMTSYELEKKIRMIDLPFQAKYLHGGKNILSQLAWSEFGDYVRNVLKGGVEKERLE